MPNIIVPQRRVWTRQPQGASRLDRRFNTPGAQVYTPIGGLTFSAGEVSGKPLVQSAFNAAYTGPRIVSKGAAQALRLFADHGGNDDDSFVFPNVTTGISGGAGGLSHTLVVQFWAESSSFQQSVFTCGNLTVALTSTGLKLGFFSSNNYTWYYQGNSPTQLFGKWHTVVVSGTRGRGGDLTLIFDGVRLIPNTGSQAYILGSYGNVPILPLLSPNDGYTNYYHLNGYISLAGSLPGVFLDHAAAAALCDNPWQIFAKRDRYSFVSLGGGSSLNAAASGADTASGSATLAAQVALAGVGVSVAGGGAAAGVAVPLSAAGISVAGGAANGKATVTISAAGLAQAAGQAGLSATVLRQAAGAATAAGNATLAVQLNALAAGAAQAGGSANMSGGAPGALSATGGDVAGGTAVLSINVQLAAAGNAQAGGAANGTASAPGALAAAGQANASGWASWSTTVTLTAAGFVQAMGAGTFSVVVPLSASGSAQAGGQAQAASVNSLDEVWPLPSDVRLGVTYGKPGSEYVGEMILETGPSEASIAAAVMAQITAYIPPDIPTAVWSKVLP